MRTGVEKVKVDQEKLAETVRVGRDSVADALTYLTGNKVGNFYARVINQMDRVAIPGFGTMGVSVQHGRYIFIYDPVFAARVTFEEVCATCEHEVLHIILDHIPRSLQKRRIFALEEDQQLFDLTSNLGVDAAANELLARNWAKIKDQVNKPLGMWVLPESFDPPMPKDMAYEDYQHMLIDLLKQRLKTPPQAIYQLAKKLLDKEQKALQKAFSKENQNGDGSNDADKEEKEQENGSGGSSKDDSQKKDNSQDSQGQGSGSMPPSQPQAGDGQGEGSQGQNQGNGQGQGQGNPEDLLSDLENLDPVDQKILEMIMHSLRPHLAWQITSDQTDEGEAHKLAEHGRELIKATLSSHEKSRGTLPGHIMEMIRKMLTPPVVPWTQFLHNIVQRTRQTKKERGMSRPSKKLSALKVYARLKEEEGDPRFIHLNRMIRRMPVFPGIKQNNKFTIVYVVDTSGSMGRDELSLGLSELQHIQKADSDIDICVIYIDTHISKEYWIGPSDEIDFGLTGRGGTDFEPAFQHVLEMTRRTDKAPDIMIYCTDGYAPPPTTRIPIPCVWLLTPRGQPVMADSGHITIMMKDYQLEDANV
jgi:predicted metal-dependent peptidase